MARSASFSCATEIREYSVAQVLRDHAAESFDLVRATAVERGDYGALLLKIKT